MQLQPSRSAVAAPELEVVPPARARKGRPGRRLPVGAIVAVGQGAVGILVTLALWQLLRLVGVLPSTSVPAPWTVFGALAFELSSGALVTPLRETVTVWSYGLLVTLAIGVPLGLLVGLSRWADAAFTLLFDVVRPVPAVALVPVAIVLLGLGTEMQVPLIVLAAAWPVVFNTSYGVRNVDPALRDSGRSLGLSRLALVRRVVLPAALPPILTGVRLAAAIAVVLTVVTEIVASATGLGHYVSLTQQAGRYQDSLAGVVLAGLFGVVVNAALVLLESWVLSWHRGMTRAST